MNRAVRIAEIIDALADELLDELGSDAPKTVQVAVRVMCFGTEMLKRALSVFKPAAQS